MIEIAPDAKVSKLADIEDSTRGSKIIIGPKVVIDSFVKIKPAGGSGDVVIGEGSFVNSGTVIYTGNGVTIGRSVLIAANCTIAPVNHQYLSRNETILDQRFSESRGGIEIGDDVWLGAGVIVLDGACIPQGCVIAAGSVVEERLEEFGIYAGNPLEKYGERR